MVRKFSALVVLAGFLVSPAAGFDTYWLSQCSQKGGEQFGFTEDAWKIMQLGHFSPDFFGPVSEYASKNLKGQELEVLNQSEATWFEFLSKHTDPNKWPFQVKSGIYPPIASARNTHTRMNHDNSR